MAVYKSDDSSCNEAVSYRKVSFMNGVIEMLHARYVTQRFSKHMHEDYAVGIIEKGAIEFRYRGSDLVAPQGMINMVVPGEVHDGHAVSDEGWSYRMFYLSPEILFNLTAEITTKPVQPNFRDGVLDDSLLAQDIAYVHRTINADHASSLEKESLLLSLLIDWISRHADETESWPDIGNEHRAVKLARDFMEDSFSLDMSLEEISSLGNLSHFHFIRVFEKEIGITPHAYLSQVRVNRAKAMLSGSDRLADIASRCGFYDQSHFTRQFRKQFGITPGKYRNFIQNS
ncbi:AraC family transcriptional regulator [Maridesulfovibrio zosterae]|uniref:AraC family transcriptional regulator n=1 Tax=Maridesulfovibrio zosterae TaxID=82171 RepID=UPI0004863CA7|nr:AraC family transcriptional regulator [Maridesulfovibrio zosterae]